MISHFDTDAAARAAANDLVFLSPIDDPIHGIPIGDGSTGCMIWPEKDRLVLAVNNTDLWDIQEVNKWTEGNSTSLRHAGRLEIRFNMPVFDLLYQSDYEARLSLADARMELHSKTVFSDVSIRAFASCEKKLTVIECEGVLSDSTTPEVTLEHWGSRTFSTWYSSIRRDPSVGLSGTSADAGPGAVYITHRLKTGVFCIAVAVESEAPFSAERLHGHAGRIGFARSEKPKFRIFLTVTLAGTEREARAEAEKRLKEAIEEGAGELYRKHAASWRKVWERGFISIPDGYLENLWYLTIYYANSQMKGVYPPRFCNGIWGYQRDFMPWNNYFHFNMQLGYFPLLAANQSELLKPYLDHRYRQLPYAVRFAREQKGVEGAFYADVSSASGECDKGTHDNLSPGGQIAQTFWLYYRFTGDRDFLQTRAWPVIRKTAEFYANMVRLGDDGFYHIYSSQAYEGTPLMDDVITDHATMRAIFRIAIDCMDLLAGLKVLDAGDDHRAAWGELLERLAPIKTVPLEEDEYYEREGRKYIAAGVGKDKPVLTDKAPVTGVYTRAERGWESQFEDHDYWREIPTGFLVRTSFNTKHLVHYYGVPGPEFALLTPCGVVGLKDSGGELFNALVNIARLEKRNKVSKDQLKLNEQEGVFNMEWVQNPIVLARLGLADELRDTVADTVGTWQLFFNGFGFEGGYLDMVNECFMRFYYRTVSDEETGEKFPFPAWPFRHFTFEALPILAAAANETLIQSHENRIRLFPSCYDRSDCAFRLAAEGGFTVQSRLKDGEVLYAAITAARDGTARLVDPWGSKAVYASRIVSDRVCKGEYIKCEPDAADDVAEINLRDGECVLITKDEKDAENWTQSAKPVCKPKNTGPKRLGRSWLGAPRMF